MKENLLTVPDDDSTPDEDENLRFSLGDERNDPAWRLYNLEILKG